MQGLQPIHPPAPLSSHHPDGFREQSGEETEGDEDHPLRAGRDPDPALRSQPLRPGADVAHQTRSRIAIMLIREPEGNRSEARYGASAVSRRRFSGLSPFLARRLRGSVGSRRAASRRLTE